MNHTLQLYGIDLRGKKDRCTPRSCLVRPEDMGEFLIRRLRQRRLLKEERRNNKSGGSGGGRGGGSKISNAVGNCAE